MLDGNNLGATGQLQWLENGLLTSTAWWKIIFTSVITNTTTKQNDAWGAYQTEWNSLKDFINTNNIQGVVFISGDLHLGAIDNGAHNGNPGFPEMCVAMPNSLQVDNRCATAAVKLERRILQRYVQWFRVGDDLGGSGSINPPSSGRVW